MTPYLVGVGAPVGFTILHGLLARSAWGKRLPPQKLAARACAIGGLLEWIYWGSLSAPLFGLVCSFATAHVYFHVFNMSETARRIRQLVARYRGLALTEGTGSTEKIALRLARLEALGEIRRFDSVYRSRGGPLTWAARWIVAYERFLFPRRFTPRG